MGTFLFLAAAIKLPDFNRRIERSRRKFRPYLRRKATSHHVAINAASGNPAQSIARSHI